MGNLVILPILIPVVVAVLSLVVRKSSIAVRTLGITGSGVLLAVSIFILYNVSNSGTLVYQAGNWKAPYGITLVADLFSAIMLTFSGIIAFTISIFSSATIEKKAYKFNFFLLFHTLLMGVNGAFLTGDLFNLYVWYEVMLLSSFVLITLGGDKKQLDGAIKYVTINLVSSLLFLAALGLLYGKAGTLNMADLALKLRENPDARMFNSSAMVFFVAFGIKSAIFPFFFWLPASYHTPPVAVTALFAGLLTKVGVYSLIRFNTLFFVHDIEFWKTMMLIIAGLTMVIGVITAASQYDIRRILSFHIISQIGYMVLGLGFFTPLGIAGAIYYMGHNIFAKTNTFLAGAMVARIKGSFYLKSIGGLYQKHPWIAVLFLIPAFTLAGVPPFSGFVGKFILVKAGFDAGYYFVTFVALLVGLITLFSMIKIWNEAFWKDQPDKPVVEDAAKGKVTFGIWFPSLILGIINVLMGILAAPVFRLCMRAGEQLMDPTNYIRTVLNIPI